MEGGNDERCQDHHSDWTNLTNPESEQQDCLTTVILGGLTCQTTSDLKDVTIMEVGKNKIVKMLLFVSTVLKNLGKKSQKILCRHLKSP